MNYTEADVERDNGTVTEHIDGTRMGVMTARASLCRLKAAALEGAKVQGLVEQVATRERIAAALQARVAVEEESHKRTMSELDESEKEVTTLRARVAELERERDALLSKAESEEWDTDAATWKANEKAEEVKRLESERDALRAQVETVPTLVRKALHRHGLSASLCHESAEEVRRALSAPPAETTPQPEAPLLCAGCSKLGKRAHTVCGTSGCECFCGRVRIVSGEEARALVANAETTPAPERAEVK